MSDSKWWRGSQSMPILERPRHLIDDFGSYNGCYKWKNKKSSKVVKTKVSQIDLSRVKPKRAGIILYTYHDNVLYFGVGLDSTYHDLTDFGGTVVYRTDKNVIRGAIREFEEETLGIFDTITYEDIRNCPVLYDKNNLIIFLRLDICPNDISKRFNDAYIKNTNINPEVCSITWLNLDDLNNSIKNDDIIFNRVKNFLRRAGDFLHIL